MKWIDASSGMSPKSRVVLVKRLDGSYDIGYKGKYKKYFNKEGKDIREGIILDFWMDVDIPENIDTEPTIL